MAANHEGGNRLFWRARARRAAAQPDFADYGTAFGLELSMQAPEDLPAEPAPAARDAGWWRRLAARRNAERG